MYDKKVLANFKRTNISKDSEKTKDRIRYAWYDAPLSKRDEILELSGLKKLSIHRVYKTGIVTARAAVAFSQVLSIDPEYLIGVTDEPREYSDDILHRFVTGLGYKVRRAYGTHNKKIGQTPTSDEQLPNQDNEQNGSPESPEGLSPGLIDIDSFADKLFLALDDNTISLLNNLCEDELQLLVKGLVIQSKLNKQKMNHLLLVKYLLLT